MSMRKTCRSTIKPSSNLKFFLNLYEDNLLFNQFSVRPSIVAAQITILYRKTNLYYTYQFKILSACDELLGD